MWDADVYYVHLPAVLLYAAHARMQYMSSSTDSDSISAIQGKRGSPACLWVYRMAQMLCC